MEYLKKKRMEYVTKKLTYFKSHVQNFRFVMVTFHIRGKMNEPKTVTVSQQASTNVSNTIVNRQSNTLKPNNTCSKNTKQS